MRLLRGIELASVQELMQAADHDESGKLDVPSAGKIWQQIVFQSLVGIFDITTTCGTFDNLLASLVLRIVSTYVSTNNSQV